MSKHKHNPESENEKDVNQNPEASADTNETENQAAENKPVAEDHLMPEEPTDATSKVEEELSLMKDKYLRLYSEFDNFRKRTAKEKNDLTKTANADMLTALLPVIDDFERAQKSLTEATDVDAVKQGVALVFNKLSNVLQQKGLKPMETIGQPFDADLHEAITQIPAPEESLKGKVVDEIEKGYFLNDKVIRFAKVIVGA